MESIPSDSPDGDYHSWTLWVFFNVILQVPPTGVYFALLGVCFLIIISALISGSEVAYFSLSQKEFNSLRDLPGKAAHTVIRLLNRPRYLLATILIINNLVNVAIVIISYYIFANTINMEGYPILGFLINVIGVSFFLVLFGEVLPKIYATKYNLKLATALAIPLSFLERLARPFSYALVTSTRIIENRLQKARVGEFNADELEQAIDLTTTAKTSKQEINILKGIVKFGNTTVKQIMRARVDVIAVDNKIKYHELLEVINDSGYSRIPVYSETLDNVEGILYVKDLLQHLDEDNDFHWLQLLRAPAFTPESKKIDDLLKEIQTNQVHLVVAVDEYGGTSGIVTLEDILEEVIGDIKDEYDSLPEMEFEKIDSTNYIFEGKTLLKDICKVMHIKDDVFDKVKGDADSLAGLILELSGKFPKHEEQIDFKDFTFTVVSLGDNRVRKVKVTIKDEVPND